MRVFCTGSRGFIGKHVVKALLDRGHSVRPTDLKPHKGQWSGGIWVDITDLPRLESVFKNSQPIDAVIHLAAQSSIQASWKNAIHDATVNILGTINLLGLCQRYKVKRFVFASTSAVYAPKTTMPYMEDDTVGPLTPYGVSKAAAEHYIRISGLSYAILRLGNVYGPGQVPLGESILIARALASIYQGEQFRINGDGEQTRDFIYVEDVARAFRKAAEIPAQGIFNIASGSSVSINHVCQLIIDSAGTRGDFIHGLPKPGELQDVILCSDHAMRSLEWGSKTTIREGLKKTIEAWPKP